VFKEDRYMAPHYAYYVREMKIKAYAQVRGLKTVVRIRCLFDPWTRIQDPE
jgi:hypothetical protein